jgi:hypothetical protein
MPCGMTRAGERASARLRERGLQGRDGRGSMPCGMTRAGERASARLRERGLHGQCAYGRPCGAHWATFSLTLEGFALGAARRAHWATFRAIKVVGVQGRRVVHRAWLWTTRLAPLRPGGGLSTTAKHPVVNPCSRRRRPRSGALTRDGVAADGLFRLPCPWGDCPARWPLDGPHETRSPRGAGRPRRATGCSARFRSQERRSVSDPPGLPTRQVIPQLAGVCPVVSQRSQPSRRQVDDLS